MSFEDLKGKMLARISGLEEGSENVEFLCWDDSRFKMYHSQSCCEQVSVEDVTGDIEDILGSAILLAEEVTSKDNPKENSDSHTWTFYKLSTIKGSVTIRWYGSSNGYYSETVNFEEIEE